MSLTERSRSSSKIRPFPVCIRSYETPDMRFEINQKSTGKDLFELVCRTLGLREIWYFGLQFHNTKGELVWLKFHKKVSEVSSKKESPASFYLRVKFYPEDVFEDVIQDVTCHYLFCQIKHSIISMDIYCPPERTVLLASYVLQAKYGDCEEFHLDVDTFSKEDLIPQRVLDQFQMSPEMWIEKIKQWHAEVKGLTKEDAELEYLKAVQNLEMYGVNYFQIKNKKKTDLWLGVTSFGLNIYELDNRLKPIITFPWNEVKDVAYKDKKFIIKMSDRKSPDFTFMVEKAKTNKLILDLCQGNYDLFMNRRRPDNVEIHQIKMKAREEKTLKMMEREMLLKEKKLREAIEKKQKEQEGVMRELENKYHQLQEELQTSKDALLKSELTAELLNEKVSLIEEEVRLLKLKEAETEIEKQELQLTSIKTEEEKVFLEKRAVEAELMAVQIVEECDRRTKEANQLKAELTETRMAEEESRKKFQDFLKLYMSKFQSLSTVIDASSNGDISHILPTLDVSSLSREIDKDRSEFLEKGQHLQKQLKNLKTEIEVLKVGEKQSHNDELHEQLTSDGDNKCLTMGKVKVGTTKSRVQFFEDL